MNKKRHGQKSQIVLFYFPRILQLLDFLEFNLFYLFYSRIVKIVLKYRFWFHNTITKIISKKIFVCDMNKCG